MHILYPSANNKLIESDAVYLVVYFSFKTTHVNKYD